MFSVHYGISPMPSSRQAVKKILEHVPGDFQGKIIDLGSGFGHLARALAHHCPSAQVEGIEASPLPWFISFCYPHPSNLSFKKGDFLNYSLDSAQYLVCYLCPSAMVHLQVKFQQLQPGTVVISNTFALPSKKPIWVYHVTDLYYTPIYGYRY
ncbi:MAG: methyltransferase [Verrucomicrobia bacterium]|nr:methyltransferase [Verrucomicrobiota bacterium]MBS0647459.1 methyltransferase [Verrucomicrobiota bacterium]